ncbi:ovostatin-like isoform X2 [Hemicordylus capensis]|uniref:ovostatin-like isoform X2 n=1 Tax=Hemicordylus capensis TaxID=884348 RepID=UPI0023042C46|nr:ovostatin-like isoform X2 [Hemicordylus capensis]
MGFRIFFVGLLFHLTFADPQYVLIVPAVLQNSVSNEACVQLLNLNETVSLSVVLEYKKNDSALWKGTVDKTAFSHCFSFEVPPAAADPLGFIVLSVKGSSVSFLERRSVAIRNISTTTFIQTDKPIYRPGQKVMFRAVTLDINFRPVNKMFPLIYVQDPQGNRILQWQNQMSSRYILQLEFELSRFLNLGNYQIIVEDTSTSSTSQWVRVEEYVLPQYEVTIKAPQRISPFAEEFKVDICAVYNYGQPVQGTAQLRVCRQHYYNPRCNEDSSGICEADSAKLGKDGCISRLISTKAFRLYANQGVNRYFFMSLQVEGVVTENGTGVQISSSSYISVYQARKTIILNNLNSYYKRGIPYTGQIQLRDENEVPIANGLINLQLNGEVVANYTTDQNGIANFSIKTSDLHEPSYKLKAVYQSDQCSDDWWLETNNVETYEHSIGRFFSRTNSYMQIEPVLEELKCDQQRPVTVHYILNKDQDGDMRTSLVNFYYVMITKGKIVEGGKKQVHIQTGRYGRFSLPLSISQKLAPRTTLLVYTLHDELVADSISFVVERCFRNQVSLQLSEKQVLPASNVGLYLSAAANSLCALRAVDKSILLLSPGADLTPESVYYQFPYLDSYGYYYNGLNLEDYPEEPCVKQKNTFFDGMYYIPVNVTNDGSVFDIFRNLGLKVFTTSKLQKPVVCKDDFECKRISTTEKPDVGIESKGGAAFGDRFGATIETVRTYFPETWIWDLAPVGTTGMTNLSYTVPDTITEWEANVFCVNDKVGFGISRPASLRVFQPFFVDMSMPYSVIRGEIFSLKANVFNYLNGCIEISAVLGESPDYKAENLSSGGFARICANERKTYTWTITPQKLGSVNFTVTAEAKPSELSVGRRDTIVKPLLVEPEGIKKEVTQSSFLCTNDTTISESVTIKLPENVVQGSARASSTVLGDVLGTALRSVENLLKVPYGCGEQNIAMFLSNYIILDYLNKTNQLTEEKRSRITGFLSSGYLNQLAFKLSDGSFSTFGSRDAKGNLWLTSLVCKAFALSRNSIYIDSDILSQAVIWIASQQESDGSFLPTGNIYNNALEMDGTDEKVVLTAFITASLQETGLPSAYSVVKNGLSYLDAVMNNNVESTMEKAFLAHAFCLAGRVEHCASLLENLKASARKDGGLVSWERAKRPRAENVPSFYSRASSAEVEMNSYILQALLRKPNISKEDMMFNAHLVRWILRNQNSNGGFTSSQDSPVALQGLSQFGILTFRKNIQNTARISGEGSFSKVFQVNRENSILLQQAALPKVPGNYSVEVTGSGCVYIQTTLNYNVLLPTQASGFALAVETRNASCTGNFLPRFVLVLTMKYTGIRNTSNMAILDIKMLSGFVVVPSSLQKLQKKVMRTETRNDHVMLYLESVSAKPITLSITVEESHPVANMKPAEVRIYDYYETDEYAQAEYYNPCQLRLEPSASD